MASTPKTIPVREVAAVCLEVAGVAALATAGYLLIGVAGVLAVLGSTALTAAYALARR